MGLLDTFTGGKSDEAADALKRAELYFTGLKTPTLEQLTLPELQKYVEAGVMTPAEAQAYLQQSNAYSDMNIPQTGTAAQVAAINRLAEVADAGEMGTPADQAAMDAAEMNMNRAVGGQRGAIEQAMASRGTPYALIQAALANQTVGQDAQQAHMDAVNAQGASYQAALNAMAQSGALGSNLQGQQNQQANTVAQAANAMQQFNAQNQQQNSQFNAGNRQMANAYNTQNRQQVSNNNTQLGNNRTAYNAALPQQMFNNEYQKAAGAAGAAGNYGQLQQQQGQQTAGINAGLINAVSSGASALAGVPGGAGGQGGGYDPKMAANQAAVLGYAHGGIVDHDHGVCMAHGGICMAEGGQVPGDAMFPGDTTMNDTVHADLSPGEMVLPRSVVANHPDEAMSLLNEGMDQSGQDDVRDVATIIKAMRSIRMGV